MQKRKYFLGLDIGTDSVGYAVCDESYSLLKFAGSDAWGVHIFDEASFNAERRTFRTSRRRIDRCQQRVGLIGELFAEEISKIDSRFFVRLQEGGLFREDCGDRYILFNDPDYTDVEYFEKYPTIHHLLCDLMHSKEKHDVRLVYLALAWLVSHRGHFLSNISKDNLSEIKDFGAVYRLFLQYFDNNEFRRPWPDVDPEALAGLLKLKTGVTAKYAALINLLNNGQKPLRDSEERVESFPFSLEGILKLLAGGKYSLKSLFGKNEYENLEISSISLGMDEEKFAVVAAEIGENFELLAVLRSIYDWVVLSEVLNGEQNVSESKVKQYEQHKKDLAFLKYTIRKYCPDGS